jgi:hypothetical protein
MHGKYFPSSPLALQAHTWRRADTNQIIPLGNGPALEPTPWPQEQR